MQETMQVIIWEHLFKKFDFQLPEDLLLSQPEGGAQCEYVFQPHSGDEMVGPVSSLEDKVQH